ncbi:MAG: DUF721 domain-containing protein [Armatimonadota bacterium]
MRLSQVLGQTLKNLDLESRLREQKCLACWDEVVGERVADAAQPEFIRGGKLFVVTKSPAWANELSMMKKEIVERINKQIGAKALKEIVFKAGKVPARAKPPKEEKELEVRLDARELAEIEEAAASAGDGGEDLKKMLTAAAKYEKWKRLRGWRPCERCGTLQNSESGLCPTCEID